MLTKNGIHPSGGISGDKTRNNPLHRSRGPHLVASSSGRWFRRALAEEGLAQVIEGLNEIIGS
jgi:hypothetical protein